MWRKLLKILKTCVINGAEPPIAESKQSVSFILWRASFITPLAFLFLAALLQKDRIYEQINFSI